MRTTTTQILSVSPREAWAWLTDAERLSRWMDADVESVALGPLGTLGETGARRRLRLRRLGTSLHVDEVIESVTPGHVLEYRGIGGWCLPTHRGRVELSPTEGGTEIRWTVELGSPLPGLGSLSTRWVKAQLKRDLNKLAQAVAA